MKKKRNIAVKLLGTAVCAVALAFACFGCATPPDDSSEKDPPTSTPELPSEPVNPPEQEETPAWAENFTLPNADEAYKKLEVLYGGAEKIFLLQKGKIARMPCPQGETITLNMTYEVGEYTKLVLEDSVEEFNEVFAAINPNYRFAINYAPSETDFAAKYSVRMSASDNLAVTETSQVFGLAHIGYYANFTELGDFGITMKTEVLQNGSYLMTTFKHELMHLLGAGDAYQNAAATKDTVMQSYTVRGYHSLSQSDVAFLDILYRNPEMDDESVAQYIEHYEETTKHTQRSLTAAVYQKLVDDLDAETVLSEADAIGYKDVAPFAELIQNGIVRDETFGTTAISFREIEYAQTPDETYFGSIDPQNGKYWHGRQTSVGSSQSTNYTDYGTGILYAAPNGNLYTFLIQTGDFVLSFRLSGSFTDFPELSLSLWHISK